jgi:pantetheine-phosphate adenylyltransferase
MEKVAIYPGTFDPITFGHLDLIQRASNIFDTLVVAVSTNPVKSPLFETQERVDLAKEVSKSFGNVEVEQFGGLLVDYATRRNIPLVIRGLRAFSDFEYEFQMALTNRKMAPKIETLFLMPKDEFSYLSSSMVRQVAELGGDTSEFVPAAVQAALDRKLGKTN